MGGNRGALGRELQGWTVAEKPGQASMSALEDVGMAACGAFTTDMYCNRLMLSY